MGFADATPTATAAQATSVTVPSAWPAARSTGGRTVRPRATVNSAISAPACAPLVSANSQCVGNDAGPVCLTNGARGCQSASDCGLNGACDNNGNCQLSCTLDGGTECSYSNQVCDPDLRGSVSIAWTTLSAAPPPRPAPPTPTRATAVWSACYRANAPTPTPDATHSTNGVAGVIRMWTGPTSLRPLATPSSDQCVSLRLLSDGGTFCAAGACDTSSGFCVNCLQDSDCQDPTYPYCATDIDAGDYCPQCYLPSQCPDSNPQDAARSTIDAVSANRMRTHLASAPLCNPDGRSVRELVRFVRWRHLFVRQAAATSPAASAWRASVRQQPSTARLPLLRHGRRRRGTLRAMRHARPVPRLHTGL